MRAATLVILSILVTACGARPEKEEVDACPPDRIRATTCLECGPADECVRSEEQCLPVCATSDDCAAPQFCQSAGYCALFCG